jgi:hypothetical protein
MIIARFLFTAVALFLLVSIPQWINDAINALPQPLPQIIGASMFLMFAVGSIVLLNKLMKGMN